MLVERIENLLHEKFYRSDKFHLPDEAGILTACNDYMFPGFQFLYYSLVLSHVASLCLIDCGMSELQRNWCEEKGVQVIQFLPEHQIFKDLSSKETHIWNKAAYLGLSPFKKTLWIDADCVVLDNLGIIFELLEDGPVFTEDHFAPRHLMRNKETLYSHMPIAPRKRSRVYINSGVVGLDLERDKDVIITWQECVRKASESSEVRDACAWFDQGALMWAVEKLGLTNRIRREKAFNSPFHKAGSSWNDAQVNPEGLLRSINNMDGSVVKHFLSHPKPWHYWRRGVLNVDLKGSFASKAKIFVLGHNQDVLDQVTDRPYLHKINLAELHLDKFQTNLLAESRIFLAPFLHKVEHEYVGFASARWNEKYHYLGTARLEEFHLLKLQLKPQNVLVAQRTDNVNGPLGALDPVNWRTHLEVSHKGIGVYLEELARVSGIDNRNPSFWANNFICHRSVFKDFLRHWLDVFFHFYNTYGFNYKYDTLDPRRRPAFLTEAITINYFSSRTDLNLIEVKRDSAYKLM